ncbi:MAG: TlpA family protein disulfide reductase [Candidatus Tectimicrobiota bacterium]
MTFPPIPWYALQRGLLLMLGLLLSVAHLSLAIEPPPPAGLAAPAQPASLPAFELPDAQGGISRSADLQGKVLLVRFWATW